MSPKYISSIVIIALLAVASCVSKEAQQPNLGVAETPIPTVYIISTATPENIFPRPTVPSLSVSEELRMVELLKANDCELPCFMGITPGKTKLDDAKLMLESLGAVSFGESINGDIKGVIYGIRFDDTSIDLTKSSTDDQKVLYDLGLTAIDGVVQQIRVWILARGRSIKFEDYWSRYSPRNVFLQIGMPDEIYVTHGSLALVYTKLGIINTYATFWRDGQLCPQTENYEFDRRFEITNKNSPVELPSQNQHVLESMWITVEQGLGISVQEFYDQVIQDDSICFDIKD